MTIGRSLEPPGAASEHRTPNEPPPPSAATAKRWQTLTGAQRAILLERAKRVGITPQALTDYIGSTYGAGSIEELPFEHVNQVLRWIDESRQPGSDG